MMSTDRIYQVIQDVLRSIRAHGVGSQDDGLLLQRFIAQKDQAAFEALVRRHGPMVLGVCRRILAHSQDAEDAFQATFLVLVRKAASIIPRQVVGSWLYGVAFNVARKARARRAKRQARERQVELMPETGVPPGEDLRDLQALLDRELSRLPHKYRVPIVLCGLEGRTNKEAAQELGWPEGTLSGRLTRARQLLASRLSRQGIPLATAAAALVSEQATSASVPATLTASTVRLATLFAGTAHEATKAIPAGVLALTKTVLDGLFLDKLRAVAAILLLVSAVGAPLVYLGLASPPPKADQEPPNTVPGRDLVAGRTYQLKLRKVLPGPAGRLLVAPDGKTLVSVWDKTIRVWDLESSTNTKTHSFDGGLAFISPDAKTVASLNSGIKIWDVASGLNTATCGEAEIRGLATEAAFNAGGDTLGVFCRGSAEHRTKPGIKLLNVATGRIVTTITVEDRWVGGIAFRPDGKTIVSIGADKPSHRALFTVRVWDIETKRGTVKIRCPDGLQADLNMNGFPYASTALSPDARTLAIYGLRGNIDLYDVDSGAKIVSFQGETHFFGVESGGSITFSRAGRMLMTSAQQRLRIWDLLAQKSALTTLGPKLDMDLYGNPDFTPDGKTLITADQNGISLWDLVPDTKGPAPDLRAPKSENIK